MVESLIFYISSKFLFKVETAVAFFVFIIIGLAYRAWRCRIHHGEYELLLQNSGLVFKSELGEFVFDKNKKIFIADYINKQHINISFSDIRNVELITEDIDAMFEEVVMEDWTAFIDSDPRFRDLVKKYSIAVVTKNFQRYPLIVMSQYTPKDMLAFGLRVQFDLLSLVGLYVPIDFYTKRIYDKFHEILVKDFSFDRDKLPYSFGEM